MNKKNITLPIPEKEETPLMVGILIIGIIVGIVLTNSTMSRQQNCPLLLKSDNNYLPESQPIETTIQPAETCGIYLNKQTGEGKTCKDIVMAKTGQCESCAIEMK